MLLSILCRSEQFQRRETSYFACVFAPLLASKQLPQCCSDAMPVRSASLLPITTWLDFAKLLERARLLLRLQFNGAYLRQYSHSRFEHYCFAGPIKNQYTRAFGKVDFKYELRLSIELTRAL